VIRWNEEWNLLMADSVEEAKTIAHNSGPRQVGVWQGDDLLVYDVFAGVNGPWAQLTYRPDHWAIPAWHPREV
jgi:hypothetical protein